MAVSKCGVNTSSDGRELQKHGSEAFPVAIYDDNLRINAVPWHWHEELEAVIITEGRSIAATDSLRTPINSGDGFFVNTSVLHSAWNAADIKNCRLHSVVFRADLIGGEIYSIFWEKYINPLLRNVKFLHLQRSEEWQKKILEAINNAWQLCNEEGHGYEIHVREELSNIVLLLTEHLTASPAVSSSERRNEERIKSMLNFIHEHFAEQIDTDKIAQSASISESECLRCFHRIIGTTPIQYLREYRLRKAEKLLATTDIKISEVAIRCGIPEISYFSKIFREKNSLTPSEYRKKSETSF